jgi:hypothetical protein
MAKKTKKQIAIEKRLKALKSEHQKLSAQKRVIQKRLNREDRVEVKKLDQLERRIQRLQNEWDRRDRRPLPSEGKSRKIAEKLLVLESKILESEDKLRAFAGPPPSDAKREHEAGEETEE